MEGSICAENVTPVPELKETKNCYEVELAKLESLGWTKRSQNIKLLEKTGGNVELIISFLEARDNLREAVKEKKESKYERKLKRKISDYSDKEEKVQRKIQKQELKEQRKLEKAQKKEEKLIFKQEKLKLKEEKLLKKQETKVFKHIHKSGRKEKKELVIPDKLPEIVILDGNNMLYVLNGIRKLAIKRSRGDADNLLLLMARQWIAASPEIKHCTLVFDDSNHSTEEERFKVCTARPAYATSDDAIVDWIQKMEPVRRVNVAVFTSDQGLTERIVALGASVYKPKGWFFLVSKALPIESCTNNNASKPDSDMDSLNQWGDEWLALNFANMNLTK